MKKTLLIIIVLLVSTISSFAQRKNTFEVGLGSYGLGGGEGELLTYPNNELNSVINFRYERSFGKKISAFTNYTTASITGWAFDLESGFASLSSVGKIHARLRYRFVDLGISYKAVKYKNHSLSLGIAPSFAWGTNVYVTKVILAPGGNNGQGDLIDIGYMHKKGNYLGGIGCIDYNYSFWKDRFVVGASFYTRYYLGNMPSMYNYNLHLGVKI